MNLRILIVEDEATIADTTAFFLEKMGYTTAIAHDALAALARIEQAAFHLHLIDLLLPGAMDGLALVRHLAGHPTPNVVLTAATDRLEAARAAGADAVLAKPYSYSALLDAIAVHLPA